MRKLSIFLVVVLVTGLVAGMATGVYAGNGGGGSGIEGTPAASANSWFGVGKVLSLTITDGSTVSFGQDLTPGSEYKEEGATTLKVESNLGTDQSWEITTEKTATAFPPSIDAGRVENELSVALDHTDLDDSTGTGTLEDILVDYTLEDLQYTPGNSENTQDFPEGYYEIEVTFTVAPS